MSDSHDYGISLPNGTRIVHGRGINTKTPFTDLGFPVTMHELSANGCTTLLTAGLAARKQNVPREVQQEQAHSDIGISKKVVDADPTETGFLPVNVPETGMGKEPAAHASTGVEGANDQLAQVKLDADSKPTETGILPVNVPETTLGPRGDVEGVKFNGQFGLIDFDTSVRLPRHVHIAPVDVGPEGKFESRKHRFTVERILVLNGFAMVELAGEVYVIPPRSLVTIAPGVPHTWTACPAGVGPAVAFPDWDADMLAGEGLTGNGSVSDDRGFLMVYEYEEETGFFPTKQTAILERVEDYERCEDKDLESIRFPAMSSEEVVQKAWFVWGRELKRVKSS